MYIKSGAWQGQSLFNANFRGYILSSKPLSEPVAGSEGLLDVTTKKVDAESVNETETLQQAGREVGERRNGYQKISTDTYYRTERRGLHAGGDTRVQDWLETEAEMDGAPFNELSNGKPDR